MVAKAAQPAKADQDLVNILRAMTRYIEAYLLANPSSVENNPKFVLVDPTTLPAQGQVFASKNEAQEAKSGTPEDDHVLGPVNVILDLGLGLGWYKTPVNEVHVVKKDLTVLGLKDDKPYTWSFPNSKYETFVIVVPKA